MTALIAADPAWAFLGGSCHLQVWQYAEDETTDTLAVLTEDSGAIDGVSIANAIEAIHAALVEQYGPEVALVQNTMGAFGDVHDITFADGAPRWDPTSLEQVAEDWGLSVEDLLLRV